MRDGYLRGELSRPATQRQRDVLAAFVAAGGSIRKAAALVGIQPSTAKRHLADLRAKSGLTTVQLIYVGTAAGWLVIPSLESLSERAQGSGAEEVTREGRPVDRNWMPRCGQRMRGGIEAFSLRRLADALEVTRWPSTGMCRTSLTRSI